MDCGKLLVCWLVYNTDGWTDGEMDRQKDRQTDRQADLVDLTLLSFWTSGERDSQLNFRNATQRSS